MAKPRGFIFHPMGDNSLEIKLTKECIEACSHQGDCEADVTAWVNELRPYLDPLETERVAACLRPYGAWNEEELKDREWNFRRLLWCAAGSCKDENSRWAHFDGYES